MFMSVSIILSSSSMLFSDLISLYLFVYLKLNDQKAIYIKLISILIKKKKKKFKIDFFKKKF
jgi:hypothetical protein